jgi:hypothetical protein
MNLPDLIGPIANTEPERTQSPLAILWGRDDLLAQAIDTFLKGTEWCVARVSNDGDVENLVRETRRVNPDLVVLCRDRVDDTTLALRLLDEQPCLKVVTLGLDSNLMQIYSKQNIILREVSDLLSIIDKEHFPTCISGKEAGTAEKNF